MNFCIREKETDSKTITLGLRKVKIIRNEVILEAARIKNTFNFDVAIKSGPLAS